MKTIENDTWAVDVPDDWSWAVGANHTSIFRHNSVGALQVSAALKDGIVTDGDVRDFAIDHYEHASPDFVSIGPYVGLKFSYRDDDTAWRVWFLRHENALVFVSYNCPCDYEGQEDEAIARIVASLRPPGPTLH